MECTPVTKKFENRLVELIHELSLVSYLQMPTHFKELVGPDNQLLPYYMTLMSFRDHLNVPERHRQSWLHISGVGIPCPNRCRLLFPSKNKVERHSEQNQKCAAGEIKLNSWQIGSYFCPMGCLEANRPLEVAQHMLDTHNEVELDAWLLSRR